VSVATNVLWNTLICVSRTQIVDRPSKKPFSLVMKFTLSSSRRFVPLVIGALALATLAIPFAMAVAKKTSGPASTMALAAENFLSSLSSEEKAKASFSFDAPGRMEWHFIPKDRTGLPIKAMAPKQRELAHALLKTGLSATGYDKATLIMKLETVLAEMEKDPVKRDPEKYWFSVFGTPSAFGNWGWKVEGHHISLNFTIVGGNLIATSPSFLGSNPGDVRDGPMKGTRALGKEEDAGRSFLLSLTPEQQATAVFDQTAPPEIVTGPTTKVDPLAPVGVKSSGLSPKLKRQLFSLVELAAGTLNPPLAQQRLARVKAAGLENLAFGWAGGSKLGDPQYYRISGPTFVFEYDNTQNKANHVHTVWRDFDGDFGRDLLREHLGSAH
jgi:hypothetical protein